MTKEIPISGALHETFRPVENGLHAAAAASIGASVQRWPTRVGKLLRPRTGRLMQAIGCLLLVVWCGWWVSAFRHGQLLGMGYSWASVPAFGADFSGSVDLPSRIWVAGGNPYADPALGYFYPPLILPAFAWTSLMTPRAALAAWLIALAILAAAGAFAAWKTRSKLGLPQVPLVWAVVAILFSTPVVFAMERANYDLVSVPLVLVAVFLFRRQSALSDIMAGAALAFAPWMKVYPGVLGVGLFGLRRWRALAAFVVSAQAIGLVQFSDTLRFLRNSRSMVHGVYCWAAANPQDPVRTWQHSLSELWPKFWWGTPLQGLRHIPGTAVAMALLLPLLAWGTYRIFQCPNRSRLAYPYLLWVLALASFVPPIANDYSLVFLPLAAMAVWDRRDPLMVHVALGLLLLWWQPLAVPIDARLLFLIKFLGLGAVGACLVRRASQQEVPNVVPECHMPTRIQAEPIDLHGRKIMICIPIFNDWQSAGLLLEHIDRVVEQQQWTASVLFVDDGSCDSPGDALSCQLRGLEEVEILRLRRNVGHQRAIALGLTYIYSERCCDAVIVMDGDGEDSPDALPGLLKRFETHNGRRIVFAQRPAFRRLDISGLLPVLQAGPSFTDRADCGGGQFQRCAQGQPGLSGGRFRDMEPLCGVGVQGPLAGR